MRRNSNMISDSEINALADAADDLMFRSGFEY